LDRRNEAISAAQEAIRIDPDFIFTYMVQTVALAELGRAEEAQAAVKHILRLDPDYSTRKFANTQPFRDDEVVDRHIRGLRKAGLPA
jgi:tetratricopeptide (TPR) repeat protein